MRQTTRERSPLDFFRSIVVSAALGFLCPEYCAGAMKSTVLINYGSPRASAYFPLLKSRATCNAKSRSRDVALLMLDIMYGVPTAFRPRRSSWQRVQPISHRMSG